MSYRTEPEISFSDKERFDLAVAWVTLSVAFALFLDPPAAGGFALGSFLTLAALSFVTVGVAFLAHELAHKVVAIEFGQIAEFRADYQMLFLAIMSALIGFLVAAPGAVHHSGRITPRENGLIAVAGPSTNLVLAVLFFPLLAFPGVLGVVGHLGVLINLFLAAFNMIPFGPLDGKSVLEWSKPVFAGTFALSVALLVGFFLVFGFWW